MEGLFRPFNLRILSLFDVPNDIETVCRLCHCLDCFVAAIEKLFACKDEIAKQKYFITQQEDQSTANLELKFVNLLCDLRTASYEKFFKQTRLRMDKYLDNASSKQTSIHIS